MAFPGAFGVASLEPGTIGFCGLHSARRFAWQIMYDIGVFIAVIGNSAVFVQRILRQRPFALSAFHRWRAEIIN